MQSPDSTKVHVTDEDILILHDIETSTSGTSLRQDYSPQSDSDLIVDNAEESTQGYTTKNRPIFTFFYVMIVIGLFLYGIYFMSSEDNVDYGTLSPISPPVEGFYFTTAKAWPSCKDTRPQWWRLFSHQVVHAGYLHVISNQLMLLIFGCFYESNQGSFRTVVIFELSILSGCMGHAAVWPLRPLIGNSHGVYGLFGACMAHIIVNADMMRGKSAFVLLLMCFLQLTIDIVGFLFWFNPNIGYSAHTAGFLGGLLMSFSLTYCDRKKMWKTVLSYASIVTFSCSLWFIVSHYENTWPPEAFITPAWSDVSSQTCCTDAIKIQYELGMNQEEVLEQYYCNGWVLILK
jgi:rhomboid protease GluP